MKIKVYGKKAQDITDGQIFVAKKTSAEGRDMVILELL